MLHYNYSEVMMRKFLILLCALLYSLSAQGSNMDYDNMTIAKAYYTAIKEKNAADMGKYLAPDVHYVNPLAEMTSKEEALTAAKKLFPLTKTVTIHKIFSSENQVVVIFDLEFLPPIGNLPIAALLTIHNKLITKLEMFFDPRPILAKKDEIFSQ